MEWNILQVDTIWMCYFSRLFSFLALKTLISNRLSMNFTSAAFKNSPMFFILLLARRGWTGLKKIRTVLDLIESKENHAEDLISFNTSLFIDDEARNKLAIKTSEWTSGVNIKMETEKNRRRI